MCDFENNIWVIRQNNGGLTNQRIMKKLNTDDRFVICPWGIFGESRNRIIDGVYNKNHESWDSGDQDRTFVENINIGDILVIMYNGIKESVIARVTSDVNFAKTTDLKISELPGKNDNKVSYMISDEGDFPFRPISRDISVINDSVLFEDKGRVGTMKTITKVVNEEQKKVIMRYV